MEKALTLYSDTFFFFFILFHSEYFYRSREMEHPLGLRFRPTDEEIVDDYLRPKNLDRNTSHVDRIINTVTIRSFDPWELPSQSKIKLRDHEWCFFSRKENKYGRGEQQMRKTKSGFWKITGKLSDIKRTSGNREKIGEKRVLVFRSSKNPKETISKWVMHEYHLISPDQMMTYTVCKIISKGDMGEISSSSPSTSGSEIDHSHSLIIPHTNNNSGGLSTGTEGSPFERLTSQELQNPPESTDFPDVDALDRLFDNVLNDDYKGLLDGDEQSKIVSVQEDCNNYRPKKALTGVFIGDSSDDSDSDSTSATTASIQTSSTCDSFGSSNHHVDQITDLKESPSSTIKLVSLTQEVSKALGTSIDKSEKKKNPYDDAPGTEIGEYKMGQEIIKNKRAGFFCRIIQRFVKKIQLCASISRT